ncbi:hypothetical protein G6F71_009248 [Rhizopus microsporus]|nr:hypothetical protein G6F71_009248 [Rhizopus microsporus]
MEEEDTDVYEVERIIRHKGSTGNRMYLVKWKGYNSRDNTWVREVDLNAKELLEEYWHQEFWMTHDSPTCPYLGLLKASHLHDHTSPTWTRLSSLDILLVM